MIKIRDIRVYGAAGIFLIYLENGSPECEILVVDLLAKCRVYQANEYHIAAKIGERFNTFYVVKCAENHEGYKLIECKSHWELKCFGGIKKFSKDYLDDYFIEHEIVAMVSPSIEMSNICTAMAEIGTKLDNYLIPAGHSVYNIGGALYGSDGRNLYRLQTDAESAKILYEDKFKTYTLGRHIWLFNKADKYCYSSRYNGIHTIYDNIYDYTFSLTITGNRSSGTERIHYVFGAGIGEIDMGYCVNIYMPYLVLSDGYDPAEFTCRAIGGNYIAGTCLVAGDWGDSEGLKAHKLIGTFACNLFDYGGFIAYKDIEVTRVKKVMEMAIYERVGKLYYILSAQPIDTIAPIGVKLWVCPSFESEEFDGSDEFDETNLNGNEYHIFKVAEKMDAFHVPHYGLDAIYLGGEIFTGLKYDLDNFIYYKFGGRYGIQNRITREIIGLI